MKKLAKIGTAFMMTVLVLSIQSCHIGFGLGIGSSKDKKAAQEKEGLAKKNADKDSSKTVGPAIAK